MKKPDHMFLGEPTWETLPGGRVRCLETGHEMAADAQATYSQTKKCRAALFDAAMRKRIAPLNYFQQSSENKDKIVCKLTGVVLNKKEEAVWKHMMGKKFEAKLAEKEAEKAKARGDVEMGENSEDEKLKKKSLRKDKCLENGAQKKGSKTAEKDLAGKSESRKNVEEAELDSKTTSDVEEKGEGGSSESSDFWVPPPGERWDFDDGTEDRWSPRADPDGVDQNSDGDSDDDVEMAEGEDGVESNSSDEDVKIRTKRTATATPRQKNKRKAKRSRKGEDQ